MTAGIGKGDFQFPGWYVLQRGKQGWTVAERDCLCIGEFNDLEPPGSRRCKPLNLRGDLGVAIRQVLMSLEKAHGGRPLDSLVLADHKNGNVRSEVLPQV